VELVTIAIVDRSRPTDGHNRQWRSLFTTAHPQQHGGNATVLRPLLPAFNRLLLRDAAASYSSRTAGRCCSQDC
jgi:hypothetical protein